MFADEHRDHEGRQPVRPAFEQNLALFRDGLQPADAGADEHADLVAVHPVQLQTRIAQGLPGRMKGELRKTVGAPDFLGRRQRRQGVEVLHLSGNLRIERGRIEAGDSGDAALAGEQVLPRRLHLMAQWSHRAQAGNDYPALAPVAGHKIKRGGSS